MTAICRPACGRPGECEGSDGNLDYLGQGERRRGMTRQVMHSRVGVVPPKASHRRESTVILPAPEVRAEPNPHELASMDPVQNLRQAYWITSTPSVRIWALWAIGCRPPYRPPRIECWGQRLDTENRFLTEKRGIQSFQNWSQSGSKSSPFRGLPRLWSHGE